MALLPVFVALAIGGVVAVPGTASAYTGYTDFHGYIYYAGVECEYGGYNNGVYWTNGYYSSGVKIYQCWGIGSSTPNLIRHSAYVTAPDGGSPWSSYPQNVPIGQSSYTTFSGYAAPIHVGGEVRTMLAICPAGVACSYPFIFG